ncbi:hypothetical protein [Puniceicoccus vermicola]|uniref:DUF4064 domain-containing protein n=1 Tax=Puniceicoccus vermicola TaxID=388746 RepID=A0A7X1E488_9BACT|nr:hypothetical protein [Puniceicoccus vermicola]MBC2601881.1 hypothetical protein [Puniceicoccus vermicola]
MTNEDETHLNSLAVAHYVVGGFMVLFACIPLIHMTVGLVLILGGGEMVNSDGEMPPPFFGWLFFSAGLLFFLLGQAVAVSIILSGRYLKRRKNYLFSFVLACIACTSVPIGTVLGIFTIIVLSRESVKAIYESGRNLENQIQ